MWFLDDEKLFRYVSHGIREFAGMVAHKTFLRFWDKVRDENSSLAIDESVKHTFDVAGEILMRYLGRKLASLRPLELEFIHLPDGNRAVTVEECPLHQSPSGEDVKPQFSSICHLCVGYLEAHAQKEGYGNFLEGRFIEGKCHFVFGGKRYGFGQLPSQRSGAWGDSKETSGF